MVFFFNKNCRASAVSDPIIPKGLCCVIFFFWENINVTKKIFCMINIKNMKGRLNLSVRRHLWTSEKGSYLEGDRTVIAISTKK